MDGPWDDSWEDRLEWICELYFGEKNRNWFLSIIAGFVMIILYSQREAVAQYGHSLLTNIAFSFLSLVKNIMDTLMTPAIQTGISPGAYQTLDVIEFERFQAQERISDLEKELEHAFRQNKQLHHEQRANKKLSSQVNMLQSRLITIANQSRSRFAMKNRSPFKIIAIKSFDPNEYDKSLPNGPLQPTTRHPITNEIVTTAQYRSILENLESKRITKLKLELSQTQTEKDNLARQFKKIQNSLHEKAQAVVEHQKTQAGLKEEIQRIKEEAKSQKTRLTNELEAAKEEIEEYEKTINENLENDDKEMKKLKQEHAQTISELQAQLKQAREDQLPPPQYVEEDTRAANEELQKQLQIARNEVAVVREEVQVAARTTIEQLQQQLQNAENNALRAQSSAEAAARAPIEQLQVQITNLNEQLRAASSAAEEHFNGLQYFRTHNEENSKRLVACNEALQRELQKNRDLQQAYDERNAPARELVEKHQETENQLKSMRGDLRRAEKAHNELIIARAEIANLKSCGTPSRLQAELRDAQIGRARAENNCAKAYRELESLRKSKLNLELDRNSMKAQITDAKTRSFHQTQRMVELENDAKEAKDANTLARTQAEDLKHDIATKDNQLGEKEQQIKDKTDDLTKQMETLNVVQDQLRETTGEVTRLRDYKEARILRDQAADPLAGSNKTLARKAIVEDEEEENANEQTTNENGATVTATPGQPRIIQPLRSTKRNKTIDEREADKKD